MIVKVGEAIGVLPTIALLILDSFLGAALFRSQGRAAWARFNDALGRGKIPAREVLDGAMVILGGAFLITPGFITDVDPGALLGLIPPSRAVFRRNLRPPGPASCLLRSQNRRLGSRSRDRLVASPPATTTTRGSAQEVPEVERELPQPRSNGG